MKTAVLILWVFPAAILTGWTLLTATLSWTLPLNRKVPLIITGHLLLMLYNPKDEYLYQRPSLSVVLAVLALGLVPVVSLLLLCFHAWLVWVYQMEQFREWRKRAHT